MLLHILIPLITRGWGVPGHAILYRRVESIIKLVQIIHIFDSHLDFDFILRIFEKSSQLLEFFRFFEFGVEQTGGEDLVFPVFDDETVDRLVFVQLPKKLFERVSEDVVLDIKGKADVLHYGVVTKI
jgi:hypothetical protein